MQRITLIGDENLTLDSIKAIEHNESIRCEDVDKNRYFIYYDNDHIFYHINDTNTIVSMNDYDKTYFERFKKIPFKNLHFISMFFKSEQRMRKILIQENFLKGIYVDNSCDLIIPIKEFILLGMPMHGFYDKVGKHREYFSREDRKLIETLIYDEKLEPNFELIKYCLIWDDERPSGQLTEVGRDKLANLWVARNQIYHSDLPGEDLFQPAFYKNAWENAVKSGLKWPGFNKERLYLNKQDREYLKYELSRSDGF